MTWWRHQMETFSASLAISPHKGQWRGALMFSLICIWINDWVKNGEAGDLRRYGAHYDVIVMRYGIFQLPGSLYTRVHDHSVPHWLSLAAEVARQYYNDVTWASWRVSNHPKYLFTITTKKPSNCCLAGTLRGKSIMNSGFLSHNASNTENVSMP